MIKIFREFRYNLLESKKAHNYFKYAMGEIFLVVIGILIALQINNWNENKKSNRFELKMLQEIKKSIENDNNYVQMLLDTRLKLNDSINTALMKMLQQDNLDSSTVMEFANKHKFGFIFQYSKGAYETLKFSGLDQVKNDSLRDALIYFYDFVIPRTEKLIEYTANRDIYKTQDDLAWQLYEFDVLKEKEGEGYSIAPVRYKLKDFKDQRLLHFLDLRNRQFSNGKIRLEHFREDANKLLDLLKMEIQNRAND